MNDYAIKVENLSKKYCLENSYNKKSFWESLKDYFVPTVKEQNLYALKDINFTIKKGDIVGVIGKNGAGKSTLLKILSGIVAPSSGRAIINGRIASLLEVGTGFHEELTGRENIFLSGVILGMHSCEIKKEFDAIVAFAGVEQFLDIPVKKYSSGMRLRLAFSVAAHLNPEILLIDEVLAVGDYEFEKKCLGAIDRFGASGRTVLFVSHQATTVLRLCKKAILLEQGKVAVVGQTKEVLDYYLGYKKLTQSSISWDEEKAPGDKYGVLLSIEVLNCFDSYYVASENPILIEVTYKVKISNTKAVPLLCFYNAQNELLFAQSEKEDEELEKTVGIYKTLCTIPAHIFNEEKISVTVFLTNMGGAGKVVENNCIVRLDTIISFIPKALAKKESFWKLPGLITPRLSWKTTRC